MLTVPRILLHPNAVGSCFFGRLRPLISYGRIPGHASQAATAAAATAAAAASSRQVGDCRDVRDREMIEKVTHPA